MRFRNKPKKLTIKKAKYFLKDEIKANKQYKKLGLMEIAKDEADHSKFFTGFLEKQKMSKKAPK